MLRNIYMTKYEKAKAIGIRATQISQNAPIMVDTKGETDPKRIAQMEMRNGKMPLIIRRELPDGTYVDISTLDLIIY